MEDFIRSSLKPLLNNDVDDEIIQYIKDMKVTEDFDEFVASIIDNTNPKHIQICENLKTKLFGGKKVSNAKAQKSAPNRTNKNALQEHKNDTDQKSTKASHPNKKQVDLTQPKKTALKPDTTLSKKSPSQSSNKKFKNLDSYTFNRGPKQGRQPCNCEAKDHDLINNCLKCGRIVCALEGSGPCFYCGTMVCTNEEFHILESNSKLSDKLNNQLSEQKTSKEWKKAIETRDRLVRADKAKLVIFISNIFCIILRCSEDKRKIYDDQSEYYKSDGWNVGNKSDVPRIHKSAKDLKFTLDFATRTVVTAGKEHKQNKDNLMAAVNTHLDATEKRISDSMRVRLWGDIVSKVYSDKSQPYTPTPFSKVKVANDAFLEEIDRGMCLSMHQPWASLLVAGIKVHEGRTWYTEHRGRLWIHAASREPDNEELLEVEHMYREIYNNPQLAFPKKYPTSCLLGCVFVEDCLSQDRYREHYATGESDSLYVLICSKPMILPIFQSMQGQHKIFPLSKDVHNIARQSLMSSKWL